MVMSIIMVLMGLYVLISGIVGKGRLYTVEHIREGCEEKSMKGQRIIYLILGVSMVINSLMSLLRTIYWTRGYSEETKETYFTAARELPSFLSGEKAPVILSRIEVATMILSLATIVALFVFLKKVMVKKEKPKKNSAQNAGPSMPADAFEFDDAIEGSHWVNPSRLAKEQTTKTAAKKTPAAAAEPAKEEDK